MQSRKQSVVEILHRRSENEYSLYTQWSTTMSNLRKQNVPHIILKALVKSLFYGMQISSEFVPNSIDSDNPTAWTKDEPSTGTGHTHAP